MFRSLALVALVSVACIAEPNGAHGTLRVSSQFGEAARALVAEAVEAWRDATDGGVDLSIDVRDDRDGRDWSIRPLALNPHQVGATFQAQIAIDVEQLAALGASRESVKAVIMHELGHASGLKAHADVGLMRANSAGVAPCVDAGTLSAVCAIVACGANAHQTCS